MSRFSKALKSLMGESDKAKKTNRDTGGGKDETTAERVKSHIKAATTKPTEGQEKIEAVTKAQRAYKQGQNKAGAAGAVAGAMGGSAVTASLLSSPKAEESWESKNVEPPKSKKEASAFEKAFSAAHNAGEETFEFRGKLYTTDVAKGRQAKAEGGMMEMESDEEMEKGYNDFVVANVLEDSEMIMMEEVMDMHPELEAVLDKIILAASEFRGDGAVEGPGDGTSDSIPARLSDGEFVFTKKAVDQIGVENLETMMAEAEEASDRMQKAVGGMVEDPTQTEKYGKSTMPANPEDEEINKAMIAANRIPSLLNR